jgi:acyl carrier protein phosphodiesterase
MNFLAHAALSPVRNAEVLTGNLAADLLKPQQIRNLSEGLQLGVSLHHTIDRLTDHHPSFRLGTRRLSELHGKYSRVVLDVLYDYLLARNWDALMEMPLQVFADFTYTQLKFSLPALPLAVARRFESMIAHNWLVGYGDPKRLEFTFQRLAERASFPVQFEDLHNYIQANEDLYTNEFFAVYTDVKQAISSAPKPVL